MLLLPGVFLPSPPRPSLKSFILPSALPSQELPALTLFPVPSIKMISNGTVNVDNDISSSLGFRNATPMRLTCYTCWCHCFRLSADSGTQWYAPFTFGRLSLQPWRLEIYCFLIKAWNLHNPSVSCWPHKYFMQAASGLWAICLTPWVCTVPNRVGSQSQ